MPGTAVAKRYAQAVYRIAQQQGTWDQWLADLHGLARLAEESAFRQVMESPRVPQTEKFAFLDRHLSTASSYAKQLAKLLVVKRRIDILPEVARAFQELVDTQRGLAHARVTTAVPLEPTEEATLKERLQTYTGKHVSMTTQVDPEIIGGVVVRIGDKLIDGSTQGRLAALRRQLAAVI